MFLDALYLLLRMALKAYGLLNHSERFFFGLYHHIITVAGSLRDRRRFRSYQLPYL